MTIATISDPLERYRSIHAARLAEQEAQRQADEQRARDEAAAKMAAEQQKVTALAAALLGPALTGWEILTDEHSWPHRNWRIRRAFGDERLSVFCECKYEGNGGGAKLNRVRFTARIDPNTQYAVSEDWWVNVEGPDHEGAEAAIAMVVVPALEGRRRRREQEAAAEDWRQAEQDRGERARARLAELVTDAEGYLAGYEDGLTARFGWPEGKELSIWRLEWVMGLDGDGNESRWTAYSLDQTPGENGTYRTVESGGIKRKRIDSYNAVVATEEVWRSAEDVPYDLQERVHLKRYCQVVTARRGSESHSAASESVHRELRLPGRTVRQLLGVELDVPAPIRDEVSEDLPDVVVLDGGDDNLRDLPF